MTETLTFPDHDCGLYLEHNVYLDYYDTIEKAVKDEDDNNPQWISAEERQKCLETGELWALQWYPRTPVCFYRVVGASIQAVFKAANEVKL